LTTERAAGVLLIGLPIAYTVWSLWLLVAGIVLLA
jgi:hypothetical protein